jgi:hypothetical protein
LRAYVALAEPVDPEPLSELDETGLAELELVVQKEQLRDHAMVAVRLAEQPQRTHKQFERDAQGRVLQEIVTRPAKGDMRAVREASRQCEELAELRGVSMRRRGRRPEVGGRNVEGRKSNDESRTNDQGPMTPPPAHKSHIPTAEEFAVMRLASVLAGSASLAEVESFNFVNGQSDGLAYPSYFEKCAESMSGVRVADWVRAHVPEALLPQGDDVWLPLEHCLEGFAAEGREVIEVDHSRRFFNPGKHGWRYGRRGEGTGDRSQGSGVRGEVSPANASHFATPLATCEAAPTERPGANHAPSVSPSPSPPLSHSPTQMSPRGPTRIERLLASERVICGPVRRRLERRARAGG